MTLLRTNLLFVVLGLSLLGVVMVYSATYRFAGTDILLVRLAHLGLGIGVFYLVTRVRYTVWRKYAPIAYGISLVSLMLVLIPGIGLQINGARRWLDLPFFDPQPAEFAKIAAVLYLSCALARLKPGSGLPLKPLAAVGVLFGSGAGAGGQGAIVPEINTDMIFALVGEELGMLGMIVVIAAFCFIAIAGVKIALEAPSVMARCVAAGLTTMLTLQAVFNMGAAMLLLPLAGITLPFVSYGGSSLLVCFAAVGLLYRISEDSERAREIKPRRTPARADSWGRNGRTRDPRAVRGL